MVKKILQIESLTEKDFMDALQNITNEVAALRIEVMKLQMPKAPIVEPENMTINKVCEYLSINKTTLWKWTKAGKIASYKIGSKKFYKRTEVENLLLNGRV